MSSSEHRTMSRRSGAKLGNRPEHDLHLSSCNTVWLRLSLGVGNCCSHDPAACNCNTAFLGLSRPQHSGLHYRTCSMRADSRKTCWKDTAATSQSENGKEQPGLFEQFHFEVREAEVGHVRAVLAAFNKSQSSQSVASVSACWPCISSQTSVQLMPRPCVMLLNPSRMHGR